MPPPSPGKYRGPAIRQLSLQNLTPLQSPTSRGLKKQLSEDGSRVLEAVEVTGRGWNVGSERAQVRGNSGSGKTGQAKVVGARPKPVKVAWADRKPEGPENFVSGVEVIATKCQGQPRPTSLKTQRLRSPLLGNKDSLVYSRLQLAERLRNAWSEREKIKPNINIFLARAPDTTRSENDGARGDDPPGAALQDAASALSDPSAPLDKKRKSMRVRAFSQEFPHPDLKMVSDPPEEADLKEVEDSSPTDRDNEFPGRHLQELNKIEIRMTKVESEAEGRENKPPDAEEASVGGKRCRDKDSESSSEGKPESKAVEPSPVTAQDRRANFRRSSMMNKTITESFSSGVEEKESRAAVAKPPQRKPPLIRAFSAPSQNDQTSNANLQKKVKTGPQRRLQPTVSFDIPSTDSDSVRSLKDRIKSAPVRRKLKSAAARRKGKDKDSSDEEKETKESGAATKKATFRRSQLKKGGDIVTMVSLVSPAESDTEDSVVNLPMESWTGEEREEAPPEAKASGAPEESKESSLPLQKFVSLRKTTKSVTFHPHPILSRSYSANFPSRRAPPGTPILVPTPVVTSPALTPAQLLERDKRTPPLSVNCSALDGRGIKRKLLRSSSESTKEEDGSDEKGTEVLSAGSTAGEPGEEEEEKANGEPEFKCPKERECWNLYQKMLQKGVSVSFDTVLRGMLTPTEYRLRKNHLLLNCSPLG